MLRVIKGLLKKQKLSAFQRFSLFFYDHFKTSLVLWLVILGFGILSYTTFMTRKGFPSVNVPLSTISGVYVVGDKDKVDAELAKPISEKLKTIDGVKSTNIRALDNNFFALVEYKEGVNLPRVSSEVQNVVNSLPLPKTAKIEFKVLDVGKFNQTYDIIVNVYGKNGQTVTEDQAKYVAQKLSSTRNVTKSEVIPQYRQVTSPLDGSSINKKVSFDRVGVYDKELDRAKFHRSFSIGIAGNNSADALQLYDDTNKKIEEINKSGSAQAIVASDYAEGIREQLANLQGSLLEGFAIVIIISFALISWRAGLATALSMVTVLLYIFGYTLNTITLFGLVLALSLIVDDTTIVAEAIDAARNRHKEKRQAVTDAIKKVARASMTGTLVTSLAFAPMLFITGILGSFIKALPITIIIAIISSLIISLSLIPFLSKKLILGGKGKNTNPITRAEARFKDMLVNNILRVKGSWKMKTLTLVISALLAVGSISLAIYTFSKLKFDIFPASKDGNQLTLSIKFNEGTSIEKAETITDEVNDRLSKALGAYATRVVYTNNADNLQAMAIVDLTHYQDRHLTYAQLKDSANAVIGHIAGAKAKVDLLSTGPPKDDEPLSIRIASEDNAKAMLLANDLVKSINNRELTRVNGSKAKIIEPNIVNVLSTTRYDSLKTTEVKAKFNGDDVSQLVKLAQVDIQKEYNTDKIKSYGLEPSALKFDFGSESNNQESFNAMIKAFPVLLIVMYLLLLLQFRSFVQPLLIFLAIPYSWLGVALGLKLSNNPVSFFVLVGFFALIGMAVNNTILLTDYANKEIKAGKSPIDAIAEALKNRFRPLITTSIISVAALIPLTLSNPFWESLSVTLMAGLVSSTLLVIITFPYFWLIIELLRAKTSSIFGRKL